MFPFTVALILSSLPINNTTWSLQSIFKLSSVDFLRIFIVISLLFVSPTLAKITHVPSFKALKLNSLSTLPKLGSLRKC